MTGNLHECCPPVIRSVVAASARPADRTRTRGRAQSLGAHGQAAYEALSAAGVPGFAGRDAQAVWHLDENWRIQIPEFDEIELRTLLTAQAADGHLSADGENILGPVLQPNRRPPLSSRRQVDSGFTSILLVAKCR
jgi:hypothetical protein